jgi:hypothetical protein
MQKFPRIIAYKTRSTFYLNFQYSDEPICLKRLKLTTETGLEVLLVIGVVGGVGGGLLGGKVVVVVVVLAVVLRGVVVVVVVVVTVVVLLQYIKLSQLLK